MKKKNEEEGRIVQTDNPQKIASHMEHSSDDKYDMYLRTEGTCFLNISR